jgi:hypothetical protein
MTWLFGFNIGTKVLTIAAFSHVTSTLEAGLPSTVRWAARSKFGACSGSRIESSPNRAVTHCHMSSWPCVTSPTTRQGHPWGGKEAVQPLRHEAEPRWSAVAGRI